MMSLYQKSDSCDFKISDCHSMNVTSSTFCSSSSVKNASPTTSPPVDIFHSASSPSQTSSSSFLTVPPVAPTSSPPPCPSPLRSLNLDEEHIHNDAERTSACGSINKLPTELKITAAIAPEAAEKEVDSMAKERFLSGQMQADIQADVQRKVVVLQPLHILLRKMKAESSQGKRQSHAPKIHQLGFPNIGNTCYMNATLQCLLSLSSIWSPIRAQRSVWMDASSCQMLRCFADLQQARLTSRSSKQKKQLLGALHACVSARCPVFEKYYKQDAHELLMLCLLQLKEEGETLRASFFSYVCPVANLEFYMKSMRTCTSCGLQSSRVEDFNHISVILRSTLTESLHTYFKPTVLDFFCECGQGTKASESLEFYTLPRVLILHVKRFNILGQKLTAAMNIPPELDLSALPGVSSFGQQSGASAPAGTQDTQCEKLEDNLGENSSPKPVADESGERQGERGQHKIPAECAPTGTYRLHGVVSHLGGSMNSGHYVSDVAEGQGETWLSFSDSKVSRTNEPAVLKCRAGTAYLLFYVHSGAGEKNVAPWKMDECGAVAVYR